MQQEVEKSTPSQVEGPKGILDKILSFLPAPKASTQTTSSKAEVSAKAETQKSARAKARVSTSVQRYLPFKEIRDGVIVLKNNALRAILMVSSINFALMSEDEQKAKLYAFQEFLNSLDFPVQFMIQSRLLNIAGYLEKVEEIERVQENELLRIQTAEYREFVKSLVELANISSNHYYVVVPYSGPGIERKESFPERLKSMLQPAKKVAEEKLSFEKSKEALDLRVSRVTSGLSGMGLRCAQLSTQEVVELLYATYNPDTAANQILADLERLEVA